MSDAITITTSGILGVSIGGLALVLGIAGTWAVLRVRVEDLGRQAARTDKRLTRLEHWQQREAGARSAVPRMSAWPDTSPMDIVTPPPERHRNPDTEDSGP